jgi:hypothetical protein
MVPTHDLKEVCRFHQTEMHKALLKHLKPINVKHPKC